MAKKTKQLSNATLQEVRIGFRNFSGKAGKFNAEGDRNFVVFLDDDVAAAMLEDGWNIKVLEPRDPEDEPQPFIKVKLNYRFRPPRVFLVTSRNKTALDESMLDILDWVDIKFSDVIIRPYHYDVNGKTGVTAYLQAIYVNIQEDDLHRKYAEVPDSAQQSMLELEGEPIEDAEIIEEDEQLAIGR